MMTDISVALNVYLLGFIIAFGMAALINVLTAAIRFFTKEKKETK